MRRVGAWLCVLALAIGAGAARAEAATPEPAPWASTEVIELRNGRWFDGTRFRPGTVYIRDGRLARVRPRRVSRTVDLQGGFVIPPFGDAHTHVFDGPFGFPAQRSQYLTDGVFYALTTTAPASSVLKVRDRFSGPKNVDVINAQAGFTGPASHPAEIYNAYALGIYDWRKQREQWDMLRRSTAAADDAFFVVENAADVEAKWRLVTERRPDFIKVFLRSSDRYRPEGPPTLGEGGMDPALLPLIVRRAHAAGLRVAVANSNVADFRATVRAGADIVTHLPCYQYGSDPGPYEDTVPETDESCVITSDDARRAARLGLVSTLVTSEWTTDRPAQYLRWEAANIAALHRAGAPLALGANAYGETPLKGLVAAGERKLFPNAQLLRWGTMSTPQAIFPKRRVGCLKAGCEASFLVLERDPLRDLGAVRSIRLRVKDGLLLRAEEFAAKPAR